MRCDRGKAAARQDELVRCHRTNGRNFYWPECQCKTSSVDLALEE
ncbi:hypothetical protein Plhal304r1_c096g0173611 [Plasmopara halstedii]